MSAPTLEWKAVPSHVAEGPAEVRHKDGWLVCEVPADSYAHLIAAAPELLDALKMLERQALQSSLNDPAHEWGWEALQATRAALSKAEGRS